MRGSWLAFLLSAGLGLAGLLLLVRIIFFDADFLSSDVDLMIILLGLSISIFTSVTVILRESLGQLREQSINDARQQALDEHRRFLSRLDHELKNPLTALRAGLGTLEITDLTDRQRDIISTLQAETLRVSRLVTDLRKLADLNTLPLEPTSFDLHEFCDELLTLVTDRPEAAQRSVKIDLPGRFPPVLADQDLLLVALHNLLDNALKYTVAGDRITLRATYNDDNVFIQVIDTGIGIPESDLGQVWAELYCGQASDDIPGSGIGLTLVQTILERHGGDAWLESQQGHGTTISLRLPRR